MKHIFTQHLPPACIMRHRSGERAWMRRSIFGQRVVHGALLVGLMSAASTMVAGRFGLGDGAEILVSLGYDRIRFTAPVFIGDTVTVHYRVNEADSVRRRYHAEVTVTNESGATVASAINILAWTTDAATKGTEAKNTGSMPPVP